MLSLRKRGNTWHVRGSVRVGAETRHVPEHSTGCDRRPDADAYVSRYERELRDELLAGGRSLAKRKFAEAGLLYLNRPKGVADYDAWRLGQLNEVMGDWTLDRLGEAWAGFVAKRCPGLDPSTVARFRTVAQAAVNMACEHWHLTAPVIPMVAGADKERVRFLTLAERDRLLDAYTWPARRVALTLCYQGFRTQEALRMEWRDIAPDFSQVHLGFMDETRTKTDAPRTVALHDRVRQMLREWRGEYREIAGLGADKALDRRPVFLSWLRKPYADTRGQGGNPLDTAHRSALKKAGIDDFRVHDWRHHWASWLVMTGTDLTTLMRLGGWSDLRSVQKYAAVSTQHMAEAIWRL